MNDALSNLNWTAGCHTAMGRPALAFSRMRYSDPKGDFGRAERQRQVIGAIAKKAMSGKTLTNIPKLNKTLKAALASITVDSKTNPYTLAQMVFAFRDATSDNGISGSVYWTNPGYNVSGVGSSVLLDDAKNLELFKELASAATSRAPWARWPTSDRRMMRQAACLVGGRLACSTRRPRHAEMWITR